MNILFVTDYFQPHIGGVEKLFASLTENLAEKGNSITCITWKYNKSLAKEEIQKEIKIIRISSPSRLLFSLIALPKIIKEARKADLIHTSTYGAAVGAWIAAKVTRKKVIVTVHEVWGNLWLKLPFLSTFEKWFFRWFEKGLFKLKFDKYVAVSEYTKKGLIDLGIDEHKIIRIYNGIESNLPQWKEPALPFTFTYFGRAGASKGLDLLMGATSKMAKKHPEIHYKFILSPQSKKIFNKVSHFIEEENLNNNFILLTNLSHSSLIDELLSSHYIVIPSYCEGFGFTAAETSLMNIPLISSGMGSLPEVVSGKVITMKELSVSSLFNAMEAALNNQFIEIPLQKFSVDEFVSNYLFLYKKTIQKQ